MASVPQPGSQSPTGTAQEAACRGRRSDHGFSHPKEYARLYDGRTPEAQFFNQRLHHVLQYLVSLDGGKLLDVGCGPGILLQRLAGGRFELFGIDRSPEMIQEAQTATAHQPVCLEVGEAEHLPHPGRLFDIVLALGVLEYVSDLDAAVGELARVAKPNATIIVSMLNDRSIYWFSMLRIRKLWTALWRPTAGGSRNSGHTLAIHRKARLIEAMQKHGLRPDSLVYYGVNICVGPLRSLCPGVSVHINRVVDFCLGNVLRPSVHMAFLVIATVILEL